MSEHFEAKNTVRQSAIPGILEMLVGDRWVYLDDGDLPLLAKYRWSMTRGKSGDVYARAYIGGGRGAAQYARMHRFILEAPDGMDVDHINRNTLDNRRVNLRVVTRSQNLHNTDAPRHNKSGRKGVCWYPKYEKWRAFITINKRQTTLGYFDTIEDASAARAVAEAANV